MDKEYPHRHSKTSRDWLSIGISVFFGIIGIVQNITSNYENKSPHNEMMTVLVIAGLSAAAHGGMWAAAEEYFGWEFGGGGGTSLPSGREAVILSLTMTVPLSIVPCIYWVFHLAIPQWLPPQVAFPPNYILACLAMMCTAALGHLLLYGTKTQSLRFQGLKNIVFPLDFPPSRRRALIMEAIYAIVHFGSIALVFQLISHSMMWPPNLTVLSQVFFGNYHFNSAGIGIFQCQGNPAKVVRG
jgi:hypothetical protein